jgi:prophage regulatory protein
MTATAAAIDPAADRRHDSFLRVGAVCRRTGLSVATIYRREAEGTFPRRKRLGPKMVAWYETDIDRWVADPLGYRS